MTDLELRTLVEGSLKNLDSYRCEDFYFNYKAVAASGKVAIKRKDRRKDAPTPTDLLTAKTRALAYVQWGICTMWSKLKRLN